MIKIINILLKLICINFKVFFVKFILKKKIIFFFNPKSKLAKITDYYIKDSLSNLKKNFYIIYAYTPSNYYKDKLTIPPRACKFIFGVNIFISTYVCEYFSYKSKRIYIHHDIYDTPLTKKKNFKELTNQLLKYNFIFTPSISSKNMFIKIFSKYSNKPQVISTGYLKLDYLLKKKSRFNNNKNYIVIAPTDFRAFPKYSIIKELPKLIDLIINKMKIKIFFRPHPSNRNSLEVLKIIKKFSYSNKFKFDNSENYLKVYNKSFCMITDISGTAYTYAFLNLSPVIFFENNFNKKEIEKSYYFKDRTKVGYIVYRIQDILKKIKLIKKNKNKFSKSVSKLRNNLSNLKNVKKITTLKINEIALNK